MYYNKSTFCCLVIALCLIVSGVCQERWSIKTKLLNKRKSHGEKKPFVKESDGEWWRKVTCSSLIALVFLIVYNQNNKACDERLDNKESISEIGFDNIKLVLKGKKSVDRLILDGSLKGKLTSGRMLAIMGPSGSGKTSLLHALAGRLKASKNLKLYGVRFVNGSVLKEDSMIPSAFIEQETNFFPHMTIKETLDFQVELKLGRNLSKEQRDKLVLQLMEDLSLSKSANTIVGNNKIRGLSGGEKKRLSIACEMISSPSVIFLDEPTSGLDSYQASQVIETLRKLAHSGKTVVSVIHQPSQQIFGLFDDLLLISEGRQMYFGPVNKARSYFESAGYHCQKEMGTAEYVIECISPVNIDEDANNIESHKKRLDTLADYAMNQELQLSLEKEKVKSFIVKRRRPASSILTQFKLLLNRSLREVFRGKGVIILKIIQQITVGLIYGGIYKLGNNQASIMDRFGLLSLVTIGTVNMGIAGTIRAFPKEKTIVSNELAHSLYSPLTYFIAKAIAEIPLLGLYTTIFGGILYPLCGLQQGRLKTFLGLVSLNAIVSEAAGLLASAISPTSDFALGLLPPLIVLNIIFDGKNISAENTPRFLRWLPKVSLVKWAFESLSINEFVGLTFEKKKNYRGPVALTGEQALERFNIFETSIMPAVKAQTNIIVVCWFMSYLGLALSRQKFMVMKNPNP